MDKATVFLIVGIVLVSAGSFLAGLAVGWLPMRGRRRKARHSKAKGRHAK